MSTKTKNIVAITLFAVCTFLFCFFVFSAKTEKAFAEEKTVTGIEAAYVDDYILKGESLDDEKITLSLVYSDETTEELNLSGVNFYYLSTKIDDIASFVFSESGLKTLNITYKANEDITTTLNIYVANKFTITFDSHGGSGEMADAIYVDNVLFTVPVCEFASPNENMQFFGWAIGSVDETNIKTAGDTISITKNTTLYAMWEEKPHKTEFFVELLPNGADGESVRFEEVNSKFVLPDCPFKAPKDKFFVGYTVDGENILNVGTIVDVTQNMTLNAVWAESVIKAEVSVDDPAKQIAPYMLEAKNGNYSLEIKFGDYVLNFDKKAVQSFSGSLDNVALIFDIKTENFSSGIKGTQKELNISLDGSSVSDGTVIVSMPVEKKIPNGKTLKVFYVNDDNEAKLIESYVEDEKICFVTNHFSNFVVAYQNSQASVLPTWAIIVLVIVALLVVGISGFCIYFFGIQKKTFRDLKYLFRK